MAYQPIDVGSAPNDGLGDPIRDALIKANANFVELYGHVAPLPSYTVGTLPSAATYVRCLIYVSDGTSNKRLAVSDGTNWRWPDGAIVS